MVNYDIAHSKAVHKYFFKTFYNKINKKEYELQIWQHNVHYTNGIAMKEVIISEKARKKKLLEDTVDTIAPAKVAQALSPVDLTWRYK